MTSPFECPECGNPRPMVGSCPCCNSNLLPLLHEDTAVFNLKQGSPTVEEAVDRLTHYLRRASEVGIKAIILIMAMDLAVRVEESSLEYIRH